MIPLRDDIPSRTTPVVNFILIALCAIAFLLQIGTGESGQKIAEAYGMVPQRIGNPDSPVLVEDAYRVQTPIGWQVQWIERPLAEADLPPLATFLTCMFLHGGWMHFLGNMWFLFIFGDNVEDRLGHFGYAALYLGTGILAGLAHYATDPSSPIPTIGASGAIAGVMGAYAWFYPHAKVQAILPIPVLLHAFVLPAPIFLGIWFAIQTYSGLQSGGAGGVAWWAHIGGFVAGIVMALVVGRAHWDNAPVTQRRF